MGVVHVGECASPTRDINTPDPARYHFGTIPDFIGGGVGFVMERAVANSTTTIAPTSRSGSSIEPIRTRSFNTPDPARSHFGTIPDFIGGGVGFVMETPVAINPNESGNISLTTISPISTIV